MTIGKFIIKFGGMENGSIWDTEDMTSPDIIKQLERVDMVWRASKIALWLVGAVLCLIGIMTVTQWLAK